MSIRHWPSVKLSGPSHSIPKICPNCLGAAGVPLRYGFQRRWPTSIRYWQTFYYCPACAASVAEAVRRREQRKEWWVFVFLLVFAVGLAGLILDVWISGGPVWDSGIVFFFSGLFLLGALLTLARLLRNRPLSDTVQEPSAYYTGGGWLGIADVTRSVYYAVRSEWLRALVEANPEHTDDETYHRLTGTPKPTPQRSRPFSA